MCCGKLGSMSDGHFRRILQPVKEKHATSLKLLRQKKATPIVTNMNSSDRIKIVTLPSNNVVCNSNDGMSSIVNSNKNLGYNFFEIQNLNTSDTLLLSHFEGH